MKKLFFVLTTLLSHQASADGPQVHYCFGEKLTAKLIVVDVGVIGGEIVENQLIKRFGDAFATKSLDLLKIS